MEEISNQELTKEIKVQFIPLKKDYKTMTCSLPKTWTGFQTKFFFKKFHEDNKHINFPKKPKFFVHGQEFIEYKTLEAYITEVKISDLTSKKAVKTTQKLRVFVGNDTSTTNPESKTWNKSSTIEVVQDMILLSDYINVIKKTHNVQSDSALKKAILSSLPLLYPGVQNMITRAARYYGSVLTKKVEDDNIKILFEVLGVEPKPEAIDYILGKKKPMEEEMIERDREVRRGGGLARGVGRFFRDNIIRIVLGAIFTGLMIYIGNLNMLWMILIAFLFKFLLNPINQVLGRNVPRDEEVARILDNEGGTPMKNLGIFKRFFYGIFELFLTFFLSVLPVWETDLYIRFVYHNIFGQRIKDMHEEEEPEEEDNLNEDNAELEEGDENIIEEEEQTPEDDDTVDDDAPVIVENPVQEEIEDEEEEPEEIEDEEEELQEIEDKEEEPGVNEE